MTVVVMDDEFEEVNGDLIPGSCLESIANVMPNTVWSVSGTVKCVPLCVEVPSHTAVVLPKGEA